MASSQGGLAARRVRTLLLAATKEDRWIRQDLFLRSEDEDWLEECVAEAAKPWYRTRTLTLYGIGRSLRYPNHNRNPNQVPSGSEPE